MKRLAAALAVSFLFCSYLRAVEQTHEEFTGKATLDVNYRYLLALPEGYKTDDAKKWPLIVFLHGAGERGADLEMLKKHGPPKLIVAGKKFEAIVASLQCLPGQVWNVHGVKAMVDHLIQTLNVDTNRVYLTGLSMGGFATWELAFEYPDFFAAIVPICGGAGVRFIIADRIKHLPIWIFHGAKDPTVDPPYSQKIFDALKKVGGNVKFTLYPEAKHDSWTAAYDDPELWKWLFEQKRAPH